MVSHRDVAEAWANRMSAKGTNMFTDGKTVWSWGYHFPIATYIGSNVLFNTDNYSSSTSHHQSYVRRYCGEVIECNTREIKLAVDYPNEPIIITKYHDYEDWNSILGLIKRYFRNKGVKTAMITRAFNEMKKKLCARMI